MSPCIEPVSVLRRRASTSVGCTRTVRPGACCGPVTCCRPSTAATSAPHRTSTPSAPSSTRAPACACACCGRAPPSDGRPPPSDRRPVTAAPARLRSVLLQQRGLTPQYRRTGGLPGGGTFILESRSFFYIPTPSTKRFPGSKQSWGALHVSVI